MNLKEKLKRLFFNRAPNALTFDHIKFEFPEEKPETLKDTLNELEEEKFLGIQENRIPRLPDLQREEYFILEERIIERIGGRCL
jgi:DNA-binding HxlR family transcriptional regulator